MTNLTLIVSHSNNQNDAKSIAKPDKVNDKKAATKPDEKAQDDNVKKTRKSDNAQDKQDKKQRADAS